MQTMYAFTLSTSKRKLEKPPPLDDDRCVNRLFDDVLVAAAVCARPLKRVHV